MVLIKLDATDSTNDYLRELRSAENLPDGTVVWAQWQRKGRGQMGRNWTSEKGKNLTFSILYKFNNYPLGEQFLLNMVTSLAVIAVLERHDVPDLRIKWPNDILSGKRKICGILVETVVKGTQLKAAIIGIGLNVNQEHFEEGLRATSVKIATGTTIDLESLLQEIETELEATKKKYLSVSRGEVWDSYKALLYSKGELMKFQTPAGDFFTAVIEGVDAAGRLLLRHTPEEVKAYSLNEIKMQY